MVKRLSKYGNSYAVLIEKPILELLNITETTNLRIKTDGHSIIIEPVVPNNEESTCVSENIKLQEMYEKLVQKYESTLKKLAKD